MKILILISIVCSSILACNNVKSSNQEFKDEINIDAPKAPVSNACNCFDGIGSKKGDLPIINFGFVNGMKINVCGFVDKEMEGITISEFNVFDCKTGKSLVEYGATKICRIEEKNDTLQINAYKYLPILKNFEWALIKISKQTITSKGKLIFVSEIIPDVENFRIDKKTFQFFLSGLKRNNGIGENWEKEIGFLEALSINGNKEAWKILKNYESFTGQKTSGAIAETWKDAIATVIFTSMNK